MGTVGKVNTEVKQQLPTQEHLPPLVNLPSLAAKKLPLLPSFMLKEKQEASVILRVILEEEILKDADLPALSGL